MDEVASLPAIPKVTPPTDRTLSTGLGATVAAGTPYSLDFTNFYIPSKTTFLIVNNITNRNERERTWRR
jgi:hypothetical protein